MTKLGRIVLVAVFVLFICPSLFAVMFTWRDDDGKLHVTDRMEQVPAKYRPLLSVDADHYVTPEGYGFERDSSGNYRFFNHSSPAKQVTKQRRRSAPSSPSSSGVSPGSRVTPEQYATVKRNYLIWGQEPVPEVLQARVRRVFSADTFIVDQGQKVTYNGLEFPPELIGSAVEAEAIRYQKRLLEGKTVALLFGPRREDEDGRTLAYVFIGTDMFVNADLVMNGYARVKITPPNTDYERLFKRLESFAQKSMLGIWGGSGG